MTYKVTDVEICTFIDSLDSIWHRVEITRLKAPLKHIDKTYHPSARTVFKLLRLCYERAPTPTVGIRLHTILLSQTILFTFED